METYQAKTIQKILSLPKHRYDYMQMKIGIVPDVEKALGRGKTSLFSFSKLIEFAIAHVAMTSGMAPEIIGLSLKRIRRVDSEESLHLFDPEVKIKKLDYHVAWEEGVTFFCFSGQVPERIKRPLFLLITDEEDNENADRDGVHENLLSGKFDIDDMTAHFTINLAKVKKSVVAKL
jgi:hypothetical protein